MLMALCTVTAIAANAELLNCHAMFFFQRGVAISAMMTTVFVTAADASDRADSTHVDSMAVHKPNTYWWAVCLTPDNSVGDEPNNSILGAGVVSHHMACVEKVRSPEPI